MDQRVLFPATALVNWAEARYSDPNDKYSQELKKAHLKAIRNRNIRGVEKIVLIMFIQLSYLREESSDEYQSLEELYRKVKRWLEMKRG